MSVYVCVCVCACVCEFLRSAPRNFGYSNDDRGLNIQIKVNIISYILLIV